MVPFSGTTLIGIFRLFGIDVQPYTTTAAHRGAGCHASRRARSLVKYGITPIDSTKMDVTMRFYVENQL